ncbi:MAG TPA: iron-sulfur cluster assembly scaffold protein [Pseudaminobacter sp.]|nr:iron-sulfur cluster assembly scaffold protein [Pseudaminobacter sp.]
MRRATWDYRDTVKEHSFDSKNPGLRETANAVGEVDAMACRDALELMMSIHP